MTGVNEHLLNEQRTASAPFFGNTKNPEKIQSWPTKPQTVDHSFKSVILSLTLGLALLVCAVGFLAFALIVNQSNRSPTSENPRKSKTLQTAAKYVRQCYGTLICSAADLIIRTYCFPNPARCDCRLISHVTLL
jgi:hypothetical protein